MKLTVVCQICGKVLVNIEKHEDFTDDEIQMYEDNCSCSDDGSVNIKAIKIQEQN